MKIIHIAKVAGIAGSEGHLLQLLPRLRAAGIDARMVVLRSDDPDTGSFLDALKRLNVPAEMIQMRGDIDPWLPGRIAKVFRDERPELVHTHLIHADLYGIRAARAAGVPHVVSSRHNTDQFRAWLPFQVINRMLWRDTDRGIAISDAVNRFIMQHEGARPGQVQTIHYGYEPPAGDGKADERRAELRLAWGIPLDAPVAGSICRLIAQKGLDTALDAFAEVVGKIPGAHYVIAGDGKLRAELESQVRRLRLEKSVHFLGWRSDNHAIYDAIDAFVLPSRWEGFGLVLLEAMGHGLPVIGSTAGAIPEVVVDGETGYLSAAEDVAALAGSIEKVLGEAGLRKKMGKAGRKRLETVFSVGKMVDETIGFYEGVVKGRSSL